MDEKVYSVYGDYESLYLVYYALREKLKGIQYKMDTYIQCIDNNGILIDLRTGLKAARGKEKILIKRGYFFEMTPLRDRKRY